MHVQFPVEGNSNSEVDLQSLPPIEEDMEFGLVLTPQGLVSDDDRSMYDINLQLSDILPDGLNDDLQFLLYTIPYLHYLAVSVQTKVINGKRNPVPTEEPFELHIC